MKKFGILAYPAKHSLSPVMFNAAFKKVGIDAQYGVFEIPENGLLEFFEQVKHEPISGLSVSLPYKEMVVRFLNVVDEDAEKIGAVNTVVNQGGFLYGYNTDYLGCNEALTEVVGSLKGKKVVVMGAGGAARGVVYGLLKEGAVVSVFNRSRNKAVEMCSELSRLFDIELIVGNLNEMKKSSGDVFIQTSSLWTVEETLSEQRVLDLFPEEFVERFEYVMDIVYKPLITPLLKVAEKLGKKTITGDKMLLYQAFEQFRLFTTNKDVPKKEMERVLGENLIH